MDNEEELRVEYIPPNYDEGFSVGNFSFDTRYLIEAVVMAIIGFVLAKILVSLLSETIFALDFSKVIVVYILFGGGLAALGMAGLGGDPVYVYLLNMIHFNKKKRVAFYNPRVKTEKKSALIESEEEVVETNIVKEKILGAIDSMKTKNLEKVEQLERQQEEEYASLFFEDDLGVVDKPEEYLTKAEKKAMAKAAREEAKEKVREDKLKAQEEKLLRKQEKRERKRGRR